MVSLAGGDLVYIPWDTPERMRDSVSPTRITMTIPFAAPRSRIVVRQLVRGGLNRAALLAAVAISATAVPAHSQADPGWKFELTPYLWAAGMSGTVSVNDRPNAGLEVEQSFSDILSVLQFALTSWRTGKDAA